MKRKLELRQAFFSQSEIGNFTCNLQTLSMIQYLRNYPGLFPRSKPKYRQSKFELSYKETLNAKSTKLLQTILILIINILRHKYWMDE